MFVHNQMSATDWILLGLTIIEFMKLLIRVMKLVPEDEPELTEEMRARIYA